MAGLTRHLLSDMVTLSLRRSRVCARDEAKARVGFRDEAKARVGIRDETSSRFSQ